MNTNTQQHQRHITLSGIGQDMHPSPRNCPCGSNQHRVIFTIDVGQVEIRCGADCGLVGDSHTDIRRAVKDWNLMVRWIELGDQGTAPIPRDLDTYGNATALRCRRDEHLPLLPRQLAVQARIDAMPQEPPPPRGATIVNRNGAQVQPMRRKTAHVRK